MESWITPLIEEYGYIGIFLLIAFENIFPPIPSEVILTFGGYMTHKINLTITGVIISSTLGSLIGAIALYYLGSLLDVKRMEKIIERYGKILRIKKEDIYRAESWFNKYGVWTIFFCRLIPLIRSLISIPAGMAKMNLGLFVLFTTIGTLIWNTILVNLGAKIGENWEDVVKGMDKFSNVVYLILFILFLLLVIWYFRKRKERKDFN